MIIVDLHGMAASTTTFIELRYYEYSARLELSFKCTLNVHLIFASIKRAALHCDSKWVNYDSIYGTSLNFKLLRSFHFTHQRLALSIKVSYEMPGRCLNFQMNCDKKSNILITCAWTMNSSHFNNFFSSAWKVKLHKIFNLRTFLRRISQNHDLTESENTTEKKKKGCKRYRHITSFSTWNVPVFTFS